MSSHKGAGGSGRPEEDPVDAANHYFEYVDEHQFWVQGGSGTNPDTGTNTGTNRHRHRHRHHPRDRHRCCEADKGSKMKRV